MIRWSTIKGWVMAGLWLAGTLASPSLGQAATTDSVPAARPAFSGPDHAATDASLRRSEPFGLAVSKPDGAIYRAQWSASLDVVADDRRRLTACRADRASCPPNAERLLPLIDEAREHGGRARLGTVNRAVNLSVTYTSDVVQYGRANVWAGPLATAKSGRGDCVEYALLKYLVLLEAGTDPEDLRFVVVKQANPAQPLHAVLAARLDGEWILLDNRHFVLVAAAEASGYEALASFSGREGMPGLRPTFADIVPVRPSNKAGERPAS